MNVLGVYLLSVLQHYMARRKTFTGAGRPVRNIAIIYSSLLFSQVNVAQAQDITLSHQLGGDVSTSDTSRHAFGHPPPKMAFEYRAAFEVGDSLFNQNWVIAPASTTARDGLSIDECPQLFSLSWTGRT